MMSTITNRAGAARGFQTCDGGTVLVSSGATVTLDLAEHPIHRAWVEAGEALVVPLPDKEAKLTRKRLEAQRESEAKARADALSGLSPAKQVAGLPAAEER